jgi:hypothetical protein
MSDQTIEHIVTAVLAAIPATIAAVSSIRNGVEQKRVREELAEVNGKVSGSGSDGKSLKKKATFGPDDRQTASNPDWYRAPKLF